MTPDVLHITNGDSAANIINASSVPGVVLPWRDPMHHGPCPAVASLAELSRIRIAYLTREFGDENCDETLLSAEEPHGFSERDATLFRSIDFDEVVLWFEHDLLDQLQLLQLLDWFAQQGNSNLSLSLISIDHFDGIQEFRGIGQLSAEQMASLYPLRKQVTKAHFDIAVMFWQAFCHSEPKALLSACKSLDSPVSQLPFLQASIMRHLQEFPWLRDGLTRTERQLLQLVDSGMTNPIKVFTENMNFETCLYIGDWRSYSQIHQLCIAEQPLLACANGAMFEYPPGVKHSLEQFGQQELVVTEFGREVLSGRQSVLKTLHRNSWLGGVHLCSEKGLWCWDEDGDELHKIAGLNR